MAMLYRISAGRRTWVLLFLLFVPVFNILGQVKQQAQPPVKPATKPTSKPGQASPPATAEKNSASDKDKDKKDSKAEDEDPGPLLKIDSKLVAVPVSVTDANGEPVKGLKPEDFRLEEEGRAQQLVTLGDPGETPVELSLLFDVSGSVFEKFKFQQEAAARFLKQVLKPRDAGSIFAIGMESRMSLPRTADLNKILAGIQGVQPTKEGTAFFDTVADSAIYIGKTAAPGTRHVLVVISDGEDNRSEKYRIGEALQELQRNDCLFYAINPSGPSIWLNRVSVKGNDGMVALARQTGGASFLPAKFEDLDAVFKQIANELQSQYLLGYYSNDEKADGGFRKIAVNIPKRPELRVRARQGYYAPKA